jgi:hypothetical protein
VKKIIQFLYFVSILILILFIYLFVDEDETYDNPNFHSEEQNEFEIPNGKKILIFF